MGTKTQIAVAAFALLLPAVAGRGLRAGDLPAAPPRDRAAPDRHASRRPCRSSPRTSKTAGHPSLLRHPPRRAGRSDSRSHWP